jgi:hypothetical protein
VQKPFTKYEYEYHTNEWLTSRLCNTMQISAFTGSIKRIKFIQHSKVLSKWFIKSTLTVLTGRSIIKTEEFHKDYKLWNMERGSEFML